MLAAALDFSKGYPYIIPDDFVQVKGLKHAVEQ
jgi:hypothetical protein